MTTRREGWGTRHPAFERVLETVEPVCARNEVWGAKQNLPLRICAYPLPTELPDTIVSSIRCIVRVDDAVVVCSNAGGSHPWPGGRREPGETFVETACREVEEETGWRVDPASLRELGWLHFEHLTPQPDDWPFPHPDFLQVVFTGIAIDRAGDGAWTDTEGWETSSRLVPLERVAAELNDDLAAPFLALLR